MGFYNPLDHGKAQAAAIGIPGRIRLVKPVPDTGQVLRGDPNPIIFYKHLQIFVRFPGGHPYMAAWVPIVDGVFQQISQQTYHQRLIRR